MRKDIVYSILDPGHPFMTEVLTLAVNNPQHFEQRLKLLILRAFEFKLPADKAKVDAVMMAVDLVMKYDDSGYDTVPLEDVSEKQMNSAVNYLIKSFGKENDFVALMKTVAENISPADVAPKAPTKKRALSQPTPPEVKNPVRPIPPPREFKRPPPPTTTPQLPWYTNYEKYILAEIGKIPEKFNQFGHDASGKALAMKYINASGEKKIAFLNELFEKLGLVDVVTRAHMMIVEAKKGKNPDDIVKVQDIISAAVKALQEAIPSEKNGTFPKGIEKYVVAAARSAVDNTIKKLKVASEVLQDEHKNKPVIESLLRKHGRSNSPDDSTPPPSKRGSGSFNL